MQCDPLESVACGGALCFDAEEESSSSDSDSDSDSDSEVGSNCKCDNNSDGEVENEAKAVDELIGGSDDDNGEETSKGKASSEDPASSGASLLGESKHDDGKMKKNADITSSKSAYAAAEHTGQTTVDDEKSNHSLTEGATTTDNGETIGKELAVDDNEDDDGTVATALDVTQDVSASEGDDDDDDEEESADVEPADVKIDLDDDDVDAVLDDLEDEFAPRKENDGVADAVSKNNETAEKQEDEQQEESLINTSSDDNAAEGNDIQQAAHQTNSPWDVKYASLLRYYNKYGTSTIPLKVHTKPKHLLLRRWAEKQRLAFLNDKLSPHQIERLVAIEFDFGQDVEELVVEKMEQERIEAEQEKAEALRLEEEAKAAAIRKEENHLKKLRKRMEHKKKVEKMRAEAISVLEAV